MTEQDHSQFGEQAAILAWAEERMGSFVDVGAYDGRTFSNTLALAERGWRGLCIEPAPDAAAACALEHRLRFGVAVCSFALGTASSRLVPFFWTPGRPYSSLEREAARAMTDEIVPIAVPLLHPSELYEVLPALPEPRFCSIDTEGSSLALFGLLRQWVAIDCVALEVRVQNEHEKERAAALLEGWQILAATECNIIAAR